MKIHANKVWGGALAAALALAGGAAFHQWGAPSEQRRAQAVLDALPLTFIENRGQADERVLYYASADGAGVYYTRTGHALRLERDTRAHVVAVELVGGATRAVTGTAAAPGTLSYFKGPEAKWKTAVPAFDRIGYAEPWPGIDLTYDAAGKRIESIYTVAPGADPARIRLRYSGQDSLAIDAAGDLVYGTSVGDVRESAPIAFQDINGHRVQVAARYALLEENTVGFTVAAYDPGYALVIDPTLAYAGFVGGNYDDYSFGIAVDEAGNAYITGQTESDEQSFPDTVGPDLSYHGTRMDAFVAKVSADGSTLVYAGFIGGGANDIGNAIAVDSSGNAYVTGQTLSTDFPATGGPDFTFNGNDPNFPHDAFVAKVNAAGTALTYSGFIGGAGDDVGLGIAVDAAGNAYVAGQTTSDETSFPVVVGPDLSLNGGTDAFVAKVAADGTALTYAGYIGGADYDGAGDIVLDGAGNAYLSGYTRSTEASFPVTVGPDLTFNGYADAFVAKVNADGASLAYAGYVGGSDDDSGNGIAVGNDGSAYLTGSTWSDEATFPVLVGPDLVHNGGGIDAFVAKVTPSGSALSYAGYIGGSRGEGGSGIAVDDAGNAYIAGTTDSTEASFPVVDGPDLTYNGDLTQEPDPFVSKVSADGSALVYTGYIGGNVRDVATGIDVDGAGNAYVTGYTKSGTFPATGGPDTTWNFNNDAFVAKVGNAPLSLPTPTPTRYETGAMPPPTLLTLGLLAGWLRRRRPAQPRYTCPAESAGSRA